ncbi:hypothetical protein [Parasitella parasitica]|uniref:Helitron helicase-like domain-containing protein n=1 Tax=Parasitella parasitica TaxID=35722 RepID=A0A0B7N6E3_9FUNG|nr:hypothetical protein [Parasitella parasitica]
MCCAAGKAILRPLDLLPDTVTDLIKRNDATGKGFLNNIRTCNSALSFTSMNANLGSRYAINEQGAYAFRIHGSVHHLISPSLIPGESNPVQQPRFAQIYIFGAASGLQNRMNVVGNPDIREATLSSLQSMMHLTNPFVAMFKTMEESASEQPEGIRDIRMVFRAESRADPRRYNAPTADEIGVLVVGGDDESSIEPCHRDVILRLRGDDNHSAL